MNKRFIIVILAISLILGIVTTSVFVYLPINITIEGTTIPVVFALGGNAGGTDLGGNSISVSLGDKSMSTTIQLHPTFEYTYYEDILRVSNTDGTDAHYIAISVKTAVSGFTTALMILKVGSNTYQIDLTSTGTSSWISIPAGSQANVDFFFYYSESNSNPPSGSIQLELIYSPVTSGTPSTPPSHP